MIGACSVDDVFQFDEIGKVSVDSRNCNNVFVFEWRIAK